MFSNFFSPIIGLTEFGIEQGDSEPSCGPQVKEQKLKFVSLSTDF